MVSSNKHSREQGFLIIDVLIGLFVASILTAAFLGSVVAAVRYASLQAKAVQGELLAIELVEVARELEGSDWTELTTGDCSVAETECHPGITSGAWDLVTGEEAVGTFTRSMTIDAVKRDASFAIDSGGTVDPDSRKVTGTVSWMAFGEPYSLMLETYVYDRP